MVANGSRVFLSDHGPDYGGRNLLARLCVPAYRFGMIVLPHRDIRRIRHLVGAQHLSLVIDAVIAGKSPARAWAETSARFSGPARVVVAARPNAQQIRLREIAFIYVIVLRL